VIGLWLRHVVAVAVVLGLLASPAAAQETVEYYGLDAVGSVRVIFDGQGQGVRRMDYGPFGENLREAIKFPTEQFAQLHRDAESGQDHAQARNYSSRAGRFNQVDPVYAGLFDPQAWNRYSYALNTPVVLSDPSGLFPEWYCVEFYCASESDAIQKAALDSRELRQRPRQEGRIGPGRTRPPDTDTAPPPDTTTPPQDVPPNEDPPCDPNLPSDMGGCLPLSPEGAAKTIGCAAEHYGVTALASASGAAAFPIPKRTLGLPVVSGASENTNPLSLVSSERSVRRASRMAKGVGGTRNALRLVARTNAAVAPVLLGLDILVLRSCVNGR
jgi:RHS repeat-associated protein